MLSVFARKLHTGKRVLKERWVNFEDTVVSVSQEKRGTAVGKFKFICPAFVDPHSHIGLERFGEGDNSDVNDGLATIMPLADTLDGVHMEDLYFQKSVAAGVLYSCVMPGSFNLISGKTAVLRNWAPTTMSAMIGRAGIKAALGLNPLVEDNDACRPGTRIGSLSLLRNAFLEAGERKKESQHYTRAELQVLHNIASGKERLRVHVHHNDDIVSLLRLADEFALDLTIEHALGAHMRSLEVYEELARRKIKVVYGPLDSYCGSSELRWSVKENICTLLRSGVQFGLMSDHPVIPQENLLMESRHFLQYDKSPDDVIHLLTYTNACILGMEDCMGSLERGLPASFVC